MVINSFSAGFDPTAKTIQDYGERHHFQPRCKIYVLTLELIKKNVNDDENTVFFRTGNYLL